MYDSLLCGVGCRISVYDSLLCGVGAGSLCMIVYCVVWGAGLIQ